MTKSTATDHFIHANGLRLHYLAWGPPDAPVVVLLHGLRGSARTWEPLAATLSTQHRLIALDQRGRGESDWAPDGAYRRADLVADLEQVVEQLIPEPFVLLGHSLGGAVALTFTARHPERVRALILEEGAPPSSPPPPGTVRIDRELEDAPAYVASWSEAAVVLRTQRPGTPDEVLEDLLHSSFKELPDGRITWTYDLVGIRAARQRAAEAPTEALWTAVRTLTCPTLLLRGAKSDILLPLLAQAMVEANSQIRLVEIPAAGHFVHDDNLPAFRQEVSSFLAGLPYR